MSIYSTLQERALQQIKGSNSLETLEKIRLTFVGKKGELSEELKKLGHMSPDERTKTGALLNIIKEAILTALDARKTVLEQEALQNKLAMDTLDMTLSPLPEEKGCIHPLSQTIEEVQNYFLLRGF